MPKKTTKKKTPKKKVAKKAPSKKDDVEVWNPPRDAAIVEEPGTFAEQVTEAGLVLDACQGNEEVAAFFLIWLRNGRNLGKAYKALHPEVTDASARVMGSRMLTRVNRAAVTEAYGVGFHEYFNQLKAGMEASKKVYKNNNESGEIELVGEEPDHKTRRDYHKALGEIIGIERPPQANPGTPPAQVNVGIALNNWIKTDK